jgi:hypothetical protein
MFDALSDFLEGKSLYERAALLGTTGLVICMLIFGASVLVKRCVGDMSGAIQKQAEAKSATERIRVALEVYRTEQDGWPWGRRPEDRPVMADVVRALAPSDKRLTKGKPAGFAGGDLLTIGSTEIGESPEGGGRTLLDPWGNEYRIGLDTRGDLRIWSCGINGKDESCGGDDISSKRLDP